MCFKATVKTLHCDESGVRTVHTFAQNFSIPNPRITCLIELFFSHVLTSSKDESKSVLILFSFFFSSLVKFLLILWKHRKIRTDAFFLRARTTLFPRRIRGSDSIYFFVIRVFCRTLYFDYNAQRTDLI